MVQNRDTVTRKANINAYALYRMALFSMFTIYCFLFTTYVVITRHTDVHCSSKVTGAYPAHKLALWFHFNSGTLVM